MKEPRRQPTPTTTTTLLTTGIAIALVGHSRGNRESGDGLRTMQRTLNGQYGCSNSSVELPKVFRSLPYRKAFMWYACSLAPALSANHSPVSAPVQCTAPKRSLATCTPTPSQLQYTTNYRRYRTTILAYRRITRTITRTI